jgi:hypothetical protein
MLFETFDRARHSQDIVHWMLALEENLPGFDATGAKAAWLEADRYQPLRRLVEEISFGVGDWGETIVAMNLCFDPIASAIGVSDLLRYGPVHGDVVSKLIAASFDRDRRREADWTAAFVRMVLGSDVPQAPANQSIITAWIGQWTPKVIEAIAPIAEVYGALPRLAGMFDSALDAAVAAQHKLASELGVAGGGA